MSKTQTNLFLWSHRQFALRWFRKIFYQLHYSILPYDCHHDILYYNQGNLPFWVLIGPNEATNQNVKLFSTPFFKKNLPTIVLFFLESYGITHVTDKWYLNGDYLLGLMVLCVHIPLGMLKKIDFLGFTSFIGMACMSTFVFMVIKKVTDPRTGYFRTIH